MLWMQSKLIWLSGGKIFQCSVYGVPRLSGARILSPTSCVEQVVAGNAFIGWKS